jgi:hypothetical protein
MGITGSIFFCRYSMGFSVSASNKLSYILTVQCFEIGNKNIPPNRWGQPYDDQQSNNKPTENRTEMPTAQNGTFFCQRSDTVSTEKLILTD